MQYQLITIKTHYEKDNTRGGLSFFEGSRDIPFEIKRIYYIHGVAAGERRGFHAHKALRQFLFCPCGSIRINLDNGKETDEVLLDDPSKGLVLEPDLWHTMDWLTDNAILCVAASDYYMESDYICDYEAYVSYVNGEKA